jgi:hypothetical protein
MHLTIERDVTNHVEDMGCDEYVWNDMEYTVSGQYEQLLQTQFGCDSLVTMDLSMDYTPHFRILGDDHPIAGTEEAFTLYDYEIEMDNPSVSIDSVRWTLGCHNGFDLRPIEDGMKAKLYLYAYSLDSIEVKAYVYNRCGVEEYSLWFHTTYYGIEENESRVLFDAYPNPSSGEFKLCLHGMIGTVGVRVVDFMGVAVFEKEIRCESETQYVDLDLGDRPNGIYNLMIDYKGKSYTKKCLISR